MFPFSSPALIVVIRHLSTGPSQLLLSPLPSSPPLPPFLISPSQSEAMALPVSMEDTELFPTAGKTLDLSPGSLYDPLRVREMLSSLSPLWWSRLLIATRGFTINLLPGDELTLFTVDDAFTAMHEHLVVREGGDTRMQEREKYIADLYAVAQFPSVSSVLSSLASLPRGADPPASSPFLDSSSADSFVSIFGKPNEATYRVANGQKQALLVFSRVLSQLQSRWSSEGGKRKIRFETDPEWQPDNRVVLLEEFCRGNRTWVLLDFDRHVLRFWRPKGASIIFGDSFIEKKRREGLRLCAVCGMLEQAQGQFCAFDDLVVCSPECAKEAVESGK